MQDQGMERRSSWGCSGCVATRPHPRPVLGSRLILRPSTDVHCFNQRMRFEDEHCDPDRMVVHGDDIAMPVNLQCQPAAPALNFLPALGECFTPIGSQPLPYGHASIGRRLRRKTVVLLSRPPHWTSSPAEREE